MTEQPTKNITPNALFAGIRDYLLPFFSTIVFGLIAHAFMLTNKICFAGDAGGLFRKGDTIVSDRFGLALTSYIMPDISMPWLNGMMSLVLIAAAVCVMIATFEIRRPLLRVLLGALVVCSPAQSAVFCYIFTCAPYALSMFLSVSAVYVFTHGGKQRWLAPLLLIGEKSAGEVLRHRDIRSILLLLLFLFLFPLSCYCVYLLADNGYIHSLALYPFVSVYVLFAVIADGFLPEKLRFSAPVGAAAMSLIVVCNIFFANSLYLYLHLQFESLKSYYTGMLSVVTQTEGFEEGVKLAIVGEEPALRYNLQSHFDLSGFQDPDIDIKNRIHAEGIINSFCGCSIPFASEEELSALSESEDVAAMAVYPYYGSVKRIGDCIVVRLGE